MTDISNSSSPERVPGEERTDTERLDWIEERFHGTGETVSLGGACYWAIEVQKSRYGKITRIGEGGDLREAIDDAMVESPDV